MPSYIYSCNKCKKQEFVFLKLSEFRSTKACPECRGKMSTVIQAPFLNTDPHRWELREDPSRPGVLSNEKLEVTTIDSPRDKDGNTVAEIPMVGDIPEGLSPQEMVKYFPKIEDVKVGPGEVHPLEFKRDVRVERDIFKETVKKGT